MSLPSHKRGDIITAGYLTNVSTAINVLQSQLANIRRQPDAAPPDAGNTSPLEETFTVTDSTITQVQVPILDDQQQQIGTATVDRVLSMELTGSSGKVWTFDLSDLYPP